MSEPTLTIPVPSLSVSSGPTSLADLTTDELASILDSAKAIALVPIGSTEPHGPHLPLGTDAMLSDEACGRAARALRQVGHPAVVAPCVPYGVTHYAQGFRGAVSLSADTLVALLGDIARALLDDGFVHVAFVNNHLEPEHVAAIERAAGDLAGERGPSCVSFPNQLTKRWGRTLTDEFKKGNCHAGRYETSLVLAVREEAVRGELASALPPVEISLSAAIKNAAGKPVTFQEIGMSRAYTGAPSEGTRSEGDEIYTRLVEMIVTEVIEHVADEGENTARGEIPAIE